MDQLLAALDGAWRVLVTCLLLGAGLPVLFTVGLRQLAVADGAVGDGVAPGSRAWRRTLAIVVFAFVLVAILLGLAFILANGLGYSIAFDGILPIIKKK